MPWLSIDDKFHSHPKVLAAGNAATGLYVRCAAYCADQLTNGLIPEPIMHLYGTKREIAALLAEHPPYGPMIVKADGGYLIPDYLEYNPTREEVLKQRQTTHEAKVRAGRAGGIASGVARRKHDGSRNEAEHEANGKQNASETKPPPLPSSLTTSPSNIQEVLSTAAGMVLKHREQTGWGPARNGARTKVLTELAEYAPTVTRWLEHGADPYRIEQALTARLCDGPTAKAPPGERWTEEP